MLVPVVLLTASVALSARAAAVPSLEVPACPAQAHIAYTAGVPAGRNDFPLTTVELCYEAAAIRLTLTAHNETAFFFNPAYGTNDALYEYEVLEAFLHRGAGDPQTYLELEVAPNNATYQSFIYNPSRVRAPGTPFDHFLIPDPVGDGLRAETRLDRAAETWESRLVVPLALFNVEDGCARGTRWRMNFFRTVTSPALFPDQVLGAWSPPDEANFHVTPFFGHVVFV